MRRASARGCSRLDDQPLGALGAALPPLPGRLLGGPALDAHDEGRWLAAVRRCGPAAFLSHGPCRPASAESSSSERLPSTLSLADRSKREDPGIVVHRPRTLDPSDTTTRLSIPTTTPTRTVWDISTTSPHQQVRKAFERAERLDLLDRRRLAELADAHPNRKGSGFIRQLLSEPPPPRRRRPLLARGAALGDLHRAPPPPAGHERPTARLHGRLPLGERPLRHRGRRRGPPRTDPARPGQPAGHPPAAGRVPGPALLGPGHDATAGGDRRDPRHPARAIRLAAKDRDPAALQPRRQLEDLAPAVVAPALRAGAPPRRP